MVYPLNSLHGRLTWKGFLSSFCMVAKVWLT